MNGMMSGGDEAGSGVSVGWTEMGAFESGLVQEGLAESELSAVQE